MHKCTINSVPQMLRYLGRSLTKNNPLAFLVNEHLVSNSNLGKKSFTTSRINHSSASQASHDKAHEKIAPRSVNYSAWYADVIATSDMVDQSPVRGCMVIKPWGMAVWDAIRNDLDKRIRDSGAQNAYFPLFIPLSFLSKEAEHVDGFAKECAVVTHHRLCVSPDSKELVPDPKSKLEEPLVVRPTSETLIWHMFAKWIRSHRDLPLKINQWANVVRWEMRTRPFLRTTEFLWQEGHTAHATSEEADDTALDALDMYASMCEDLLALPCIKGEKSPSERFAGAVKTYTIEAMMQNGWALQAGTSHYLGQNFAKAFDVRFSGEKEGEQQLVWATSWGVSTRLIGAMIMTHSDDKGLVLPPLVAPIQVVIVPILKTGVDDSVVMNRVRAMESALKRAGVRVKVDARSTLRPGAKYFEWERKGLPIRIEIGPRDVQASTAMMAIRHTGVKSQIPCDADHTSFVHTVKQTLTDMHTNMLKQATDRLTERTRRVSTYAEMRSEILKASSASDGDSDSDSGLQDVDNEVVEEITSDNSVRSPSSTSTPERNSNVRKRSSKQSTSSNSNSSIGDDSHQQQHQHQQQHALGFYLAPWKCDAVNEAFIKKDCLATIRCYPFEHNRTPPAENVKCFYSGEQATHYAIFARAF